MDETSLGAVDDSGQKGLSDFREKLNSQSNGDFWDIEYVLVVVTVDDRDQTIHVYCVLLIRYSGLCVFQSSTCSSSPCIYYMLARYSGVAVKINQQCNMTQCLMIGKNHQHRYLKARHSRMQAGNGQACSPVSGHCQSKCSTLYSRVQTLSKMLDSEHPCPNMVRAARQCTAVCEHDQSCSTVYSRDVLGDDGVPFNGIASPRS